MHSTTAFGGYVLVTHFALLITQQIIAPHVFSRYNIVINERT